MKTMHAIPNTKRQNLLLEIDFDGLIIPLEHRLGQIDLRWLARNIIAATQQFGQLTHARAYACWNSKRYGRGAAVLKQAGIDPVTINGQAKDQADTEMKHDIHQSIPHYDCITVLTNDSDFGPAIEAVRKAGKTAILMYWPEAVNSRLLASVPLDMHLSLEDVLGLGGPNHQPQCDRVFTVDELRAALVTAELLLRRRRQNWLPYQVLIESLMPQYTYRTAELLIRDAIERDIFILDRYGAESKNIIFINYDLPEVKNTIHLFDAIMRTMSNEMQTRSAVTPKELADIIAQMYVIQTLGDSPEFWLAFFMNCGILQRRTRRVPGSLALGSAMEFNHAHPSIQQTLYPVAMAA